MGVELITQRQPHNTPHHHTTTTQHQRHQKQINLAHSTSQTLPFENLKQVRTLCLAPDGRLLLSVDEDGRALVVDRQRRVLLHHVSFKAPVRAAKFSPDGAYVAVAVGKLLQVWRAPATAKSMAPMRLHRAYGGCHDDVTCLDWSPCGQFIAVGSKDLTVRKSGGGGGGEGRRTLMLLHWRLPARWLALWLFFAPPARPMGRLQLHTTLSHPITPHHTPITHHTTRQSHIPPPPHPTQARVFSLNPIPGYAPPTLAGHKEALVGVFFTSEATRAAAALAGQPATHLYTVSRDGALFGWHFTRSAAAAAAAAAATASRPVATAGKARTGGAPRGGDAQMRDGGAAAAKATAPSASSSSSDDDEDDGDATASSSSDDSAEDEEEAQPEPPAFAGGLWSVGSKHYFLQRGAKLSCADFHRKTGVLVAGFSHGVFEMLQLPEAATIHALSVSRERLTAAAFNAAGDWLALGCARLGQLVVWEWRSETYVLKQQGHYFDAAAAAYSPDGALLATGADDCKVKLFQLASGFCYVTFADHSAPVTAVRFLPSGHAVLSASLDGTVRAYDLVRYRNFRTLTTPEPQQFLSLAVDPGGEVACAGTLDAFQVRAAGGGRRAAGGGLILCGSLAVCGCVCSCVCVVVCV